MLPLGSEMWSNGPCEPVAVEQSRSTAATYPFQILSAMALRLLRVKRAE
jgi:hypothetical protein